MWSGATKLHSGSYLADAPTGDSPKQDCAACPAELQDEWNVHGERCYQSEASVAGLNSTTAISPETTASLTPIVARTA